MNSERGEPLGLIPLTQRRGIVEPQMIPRPGEGMYRKYVSHTDECTWLGLTGPYIETIEPANIFAHRDTRPGSLVDAHGHSFGPICSSAGQQPGHGTTAIAAAALWAMLPFAVGITDVLPQAWSAICDVVAKRALITFWPRVRVSDMPRQ